MGLIKNGVIEISGWLNSARDYEDGVFLYNRYGNNAVLKKTFTAGSGEHHAVKLAYELGKLIGIGFEEFNRTDGTRNQTDQSGLAAGIQDSKTIFGSGSCPGVYPPVVNRVIFEMSRLYNERAMLKEQQNNVPDENTSENVAKRKEIIGTIEAVSARLHVLYLAKKAFLTGGTLPDEQALFSGPGVKPEAELTEEELLKLRNTLRSSVTRARNMLEFQSQKKEKKANPMPDCPKRKDIEERLREKEEELQKVETKLNAVRSESDPETGPVG